MTYLVTRGHTHEKVKPVFIKIGKTTRSECRRKKEQLSFDKQHLKWKISNKNIFYVTSVYN